MPQTLQSLNNVIAQVHAPRSNELLCRTERLVRIRKTLQGRRAYPTPIGGYLSMFSVLHLTTRRCRGARRELGLIPRGYLALLWWLTHTHIYIRERFILGQRVTKSRSPTYNTLSASLLYEIGPDARLGHAHIPPFDNTTGSGLKLVVVYVLIPAWLARRLPTTVNARMGEII